MKREEKDVIISEITELLDKYPNVYVADTSTLTVDKTNQLRRICFNKGVKMLVAKNTLIRKAMEKKNQEAYQELFAALKGTSALMFCETGNVPAKVIKEFRKAADRPALKGAWIDTAVFLGDNQLDTLAAIKSKNELIGEIIGLLQSPASNVVSALQSSGGKLAGIVKTLSERAA
ncbi:MAG: 50S ribosomal protein L10 [Bacteroidota bacterium]|jgi:large subunit ribosomal protein L10|uniref:50S ribosomal protein L10 n=1 Tax=Candidatus Pollutiaquabacter sp. TaxID=3416354 RepID=UPI001A5048E2|nr:50S ribosomal protein L10 [Bacteroidota bacterium]MBL7947762.1 50S ribosomal protein L10 [Bacteroidia bacterium]MBP6010355.1 50S ribosomal protein L10 [Bacteroidia bacterium]MBP7269799.1 50S ribosomal protein L10 [Bacteroidia bacterium]MBP7772206.1 50S ribosomal protein L10 [Bacteroidia bacterium]